jgi:hypothetical protein
MIGNEGECKGNEWKEGKFLLREFKKRLERIRIDWVERRKLKGNGIPFCPFDNLPNRVNDNYVSILLLHSPKKHPIPSIQIITIHVKHFVQQFNSNMCNTNQQGWKRKLLIHLNI